MDNKTLAEASPEIAKLWHPTKNGDLTPADVEMTSSVKVWWLCPDDHESLALVSSRVRGVTCRKCRHQDRRTLVEQGLWSPPEGTSLAEMNALLATQWHPTKNGLVTPANVTSKSAHLAWWQCKNGHEWRARVNNRSAGSQCMVCYRASKSVPPVGRSVAEVSPVVAAQWHPTKNGDRTAQNTNAGSRIPAWFFCNNDHEWQARPRDRVARGTRCKQCSLDATASRNQANEL